MNNDNQSITKGVLTACGVLYGYLVGLNYTLFLILIILMALDIIVGVIFAFLDGDFASCEMKEGIILKILILILLLSLTLFQVVLDNYGVSAPFSNVITGILSFMEMASIIEHFAEHNVLIPQFVVEWFRISKDKIDKGEF